MQQNVKTHLAFCLRKTVWPLQQWHQDRVQQPNLNDLSMRIKLSGPKQWLNRAALRTGRFHITALNSLLSAIKTLAVLLRETHILMNFTLSTFILTTSFLMSRYLVTGRA